MRRLLRFFPSIAEHATAFMFVDVIKHILGLVFATVGFVFFSNVLVAVVAQLHRFRWILAILFASGGAWLYIAIMEKYSRHRPNFPKLKVDFEIIRFEITYHYLDNTHMTYRKRKKLRALKDGLDFYRDKYLWTGSGPATLKSGRGDQDVTETVKKSVWQYYEIRFQRPLDKGEEIETEVIWDLEDPEGKAVPFVSATIEEPTQLLSLNLLLDRSLGVTDVICEESSNLGAKKPFRSFGIKPDGADVFSWNEPRPELLHHYEMKWRPN